MITVLAETTEGLARAICRSVSRGGALLTGIARPPGERVVLQLDVPGLGKVHAEGEIRYAHRHPDGSGLGVVFTRIAPRDQDVLDRFIDLFARPR